MEKVGLAQGSVPAGAPVLEVPASVPDIDDDAVEAAVEKSPKARRLERRLRAREESGRPLSGREVETIVKHATGPDGKPDGAQAVVLAAHARRCPGTFGGGHSWLVRFLERIEWRLLLGELKNFIDELRGKSEEERKREELKRSLEQDRLELGARHATLLRMERARAADQRVQVDEALDAENRLRLTMERMRRT